MEELIPREQHQATDGAQLNGADGDDDGKEQQIHRDRAALSMNVE